jgi:hypothetical protein
VPRIKRGPEERAGPRHTDLVNELAEELRRNRQFGQPRIEETEFSTGAVRVYVFWDKWEGLPDQERVEVILDAYEQVEGKAYRDRITLAAGWTFPEARELDLILYRVEPPPAARLASPETRARYHEAMRRLGASDLFGSGEPELWVGTREEAEACRERLREELPGSDWLISKEVGPKYV